MVKKAKPKSASTSKKKKRAIISQKEFPRESLEKALSIANAIYDNFAAKGGAPHDIAMAIGLAPTSGGWRNLCGTSIAYGLTEGGYGANEIVLTELGRRIIAPEKEGEDIQAKVESILEPKIMNQFFGKYNKAKFPMGNIAKNVLVSMGLPMERTSKAINILKENGHFTGILKETKTGLFVAIDSPASKPIESSDEPDPKIPHKAETPTQEMEAIAIKVSNTPKPAKKQTKLECNRVFISHGKNKKIVGQLKELLTFGKLDPVISVERETTSIPVPEKVFQDMRSCGAGVIHVMSEGELLDPEGKTHIHINENVLIEIGAAIALYRKQVILLVEKGVKLPSNLQGLYCCQYEGETLDYNAHYETFKNI